MAKRRNVPYHVVDVFTQIPLEGNPLAVFPDARGIGAATMQKIARELNLSETTFVLPPTGTGDLHVRIFTPTYEMTFAGHPTIGTAYVARSLGLVSATETAIVLEERVGPVNVSFGDDEKIWLETPPISWGESFDRARSAAALDLREDDLLDNVPVRLVTAGNPNAYVALKDPATVDRIDIDAAQVRALFAERAEPTCLFAFAPTVEGAYSRMFAEELGVIEDPATGSATGPLAAFMLEYDLLPPGARAFVSEQGTKMGRRSYLHVRLEGERGSGAIHVGGHVTPVAVAELVLPDEALDLTVVVALGHLRRTARSALGSSGCDCSRE